MDDLQKTMLGAPPSADPNRTIMGTPPSVTGTSLNATQTIKPIQCPVCKTFNPGGVVFCIECGLIFEKALPEDAFGAPAVQLPILVDPSGREHILRPGEQVLGRAGDISFEDPRVSRRHCKILLSGMQIQAEDLGSTNGTKVDGQPISPGTPVEVQEVVSLGGFELRVGRPGASAQTAMPAGGRTAQISAPTIAASHWYFAKPDGSEIELKLGTAKVGRRDTNDIVLADNFVSGTHCELTVEADTVIITDLGSTNGTFVEGEKLEANVPCSLVEDQAVKIGNFELVLRQRTNTDG